MPPHGRSDSFECMPKFDETDNEEDILTISNLLKNVELEKKVIPEDTTKKTTIEDISKRIEENNTYEIDDDEEDLDSKNVLTKELETCKSVIEKSPIRLQDNYKNNRVDPYSRNNFSGGSFSEQSNNLSVDFDYNETLNFPSTLFDFNADHTSSNAGLIQTDDNIFNHLTTEEIHQNLSNLHTNSLIPAYNSRFVCDDNIPLGNDEFNFDLFINSSPNSIATDNSNQTNFSASGSSSYELLVNEPNIPTHVAHLEQKLPYNKAASVLSNFIDQDKKCKQEIWILVNIKPEDELISILQKEITSEHLNLTDLNYIYAIIIRLLKEESDIDGKQLLINYILKEDDFLLKIALKANVLLMNFIIEVIQNLGIDPSQVNLLHKILKMNQFDLSNIFESMLDIKFIDKPSLNIFDINAIDSENQSLLMIVLKSIAYDEGNYYINMKYLEMILIRQPNLYKICKEGKNIFHYAMTWNCNEEIIKKVISYYDQETISHLMSQQDNYGCKPRYCETLSYFYVR